MIEISDKVEHTPGTMDNNNKPIADIEEVPQ